MTTDRNKLTFELMWKRALLRTNLNWLMTNKPIKGAVPIWETSKMKIISLPFKFKELPILCGNWNQVMCIFEID